jgi:hypothetical protein
MKEYSTAEVGFGISSMFAYFNILVTVVFPLLLSPMKIKVLSVLPPSWEASCYCYANYQRSLSRVVVSSKALSFLEGDSLMRAID